jgi:hypothetical protein
MAKNKNNSFKSSSSNSRDNSSSTKQSATNGSMKDTHAQVPDKGTSRSGPGGE